MGLFKPEVYRALAVGFLLGSLAVVGIAGGTSGRGGVVPQAIAADR